MVSLWDPSSINPITTTIIQTPPEEQLDHTVFGLELQYIVAKVYNTTKQSSCSSMGQRFM